MFLPDQYELLDFGAGRKLERFGPFVLDRPSPASETARPRLPESAWSQASGRYQRVLGDQGVWSGELPGKWIIRHGATVFELKASPFGHLGIFPEQAENWDWLQQQVERRPRSKVLNLFAYTGGSTLAAVASGAEVVHVDSARGSVAAARRNAALSGLEDHPIRWITEDALKFARRELKRGNQYDAVILDPPSYGHGPSGEPWKLAEQLPELLELCAELTKGRRQFVLLTCHTPEFDAAMLESLMRETLGAERHVQISAGALKIEACAKHHLPCGTVARWAAR